MKRLAFLTALLLVLAGAARAQSQPVHLTLPEAIAQAQDEGPEAEIAALRFEQSRWSFRSFRTDYRPTFSLAGSAPGLERSIDQIQLDDGSFRYVEQNRLFSTARLVAEQPLPYTGGSISVSSRLGRLDLFGDREFSQWNAAPISIGLEQPLFQFNALKWNRRIEPLRYEIAERTLSEDQAQVAEETTAAFFDTYIAEINLEIADFNVAVNDTIYTLAQNRYQIGKIAENDLLQSELALLNAQSARSSAETAYRRALEDLRLTLGLPEGTSVTIEPPTALPAFTVEPEAAVAQARQRSADFLDLERQRLEADRSVAQAEGQNGFSATITAEYGLNQQARTFDGAYQNPLDQQRLGVGFQVPLYRWGRGDAAVEAAQVQRRQVDRQTTLRREELEQQVFFEAVQLRQLRTQVGIAAKADTVAQRRFGVARNRYSVGNISITDLFNAQREKDSARRSYIQTLQQFWTSYHRLRRLTLYDFAADQPLLSSPGE